MNQLENLLLYATPLKTKRIRQNCEDEDVLDTFKEFSLENMDLMYTKPAYRLGFSVISAIAQLHIKNTSSYFTRIFSAVAGSYLENNFLGKRRERS